jgi:fructose-1,6-bisphosphatase
MTLCQLAVSGIASSSSRAAASVVVEAFPVAVAAEDAGEQAVAAVDDPLAVLPDQVGQREREF